MRLRTLLIATVIGTAICLPVKADNNNSAFISSTEVFDFSNLDSSDDALFELTEKIQNIASQPSVLYLDWKLKFSSEQLPESFNCSGRVSEDSAVYQLPMNVVTNHLLFSVISGEPEQYPFNTVSCMLTSGSSFTIHIQGFFTGSVVDIPTAVDVQLRPLGLYGNVSNPFLNRN
jgi:hypothetical protein